MRLNAVAGVSFGTLVGLLIGLSSVPVVASAVAAMLALLVTFFGFVRSEGMMATHTSGARLAGFGLAMAAALVAGIALRSHGTLGPSFEDRVARFSVKGMPPERAIDLATYEHLGLRMGQLAQVEVPTKPPLGSAFAFNNKGDPACATLDGDFYKNVQERLAAMKSKGGAWATFAEIAVGLPEAQALSLANAAFALRCEVKP